MRRSLACAAALLALAGCKLDMKQQRKLNTYEKTSLWPDGTAARPLPEGVVAQGALARDAAAANPPPASPELLARGQARYDTYCTPCHGSAGLGDGMIVQRGFPRPPSYHTQRLRAAPAAHFFDVISNGYGVMYGYGDRVAPGDRWAIIAYIRALQLTRAPALAQAGEGRP